MTVCYELIIVFFLFCKFNLKVLRALKKQEAKQVRISPKMHELHHVLCQNKIRKKHEFGSQLVVRPVFRQSLVACLTIKPDRFFHPDVH